MIFAFLGISVMIKISIESDDYIGNFLALGCALCFSLFLLILRNSRNIDMIPSGLIGNILIMLVALFFCEGVRDIQLNDIIYCILWGAVLNGFMNFVFIFSTKYLFASEVSIFMLLKFCLGPIWVWIFLNESLRIETLIGGIIVITSVAFFSINQIRKIGGNTNQLSSS